MLLNTASPGLEDVTVGHELRLEHELNPFFPATRSLKYCTHPGMKSHIRQVLFDSTDEGVVSSIQPDRHPSGVPTEDSSPRASLEGHCENTLREMTEAEEILELKRRVCSACGWSGGVAVFCKTAEASSYNTLFNAVMIGYFF